MAPSGLAAHERRQRKLAKKRERMAKEAGISKKERKRLKRERRERKRQKAEGQVVAADGAAPASSSGLVPPTMDDYRALKTKRFSIHKSWLRTIDEESWESLNINKSKSQLAKRGKYSRPEKELVQRVLRESLEPVSLTPESPEFIAYLNKMGKAKTSEQSLLPKRFWTILIRQAWPDQACFALAQEHWRQLRAPRERASRRTPDRSRAGQRGARAQQHAAAALLLGRKGDSSLVPRFQRRVERGRHPGSVSPACPGADLGADWRGDGSLQGRGAPALQPLIEPPCAIQPTMRCQTPRW